MHPFLRASFTGVSLRLFPGGLMAALAPCLVCVSDVQGEDKSWNSNSGNWNNAGNWLPNGVPAPGDSVFLGNLPGVDNGSLFLNVSDTVGQMTITDGMTLYTNGNSLTVTGDTALSGENQEGNVIFSSRIRVTASGQAYDYRTQNLTLSNGANLDMAGGILQVNGLLDVNQDATLYGDGILNLQSNAFTAMSVDGNFQAGIEGLTINQNGAGRIDLDGTGGATFINLSTASFQEQKYASLTVNGTLLTDAFDGTLRLSGGNTLNMNLSGGGWATGSGSSIEIFSNSGLPATIGGSRVTVAGAVDVGGIALFNADTVFASTAAVTISNNDELRLTGDTEFAGASFAQGNGTANGLITFNGDLTVSANTTINLPDGAVDWDGNAGNNLTTVNPGVTFTLNAGSIENDPGNAFDAAANIGAGATLAVNTSSAWVNNGTLNLTNGTLTGAGIENTGFIQGSGSVTPASLVNDGTLAATGGALLVNASGVTDLDGALGAGVLNAQTGNLAILGVNGIQTFEGTVNAGFFGAPQSFLMPTGGLDNTGIINLAGGTYQAGLRQNGELNVSFVSAVVSNAVFASEGKNILNADLRFEGDGVVEAGANFSGSAAFIIAEESQLNGAHTAGMGVQVTNAGRLEPGTSIGRFEVLSFTNENTGTVEFELASAGGVFGVDHDLLDVRLTATLAGTLDVRFLDGFVPSPGDSFLVLRALGGINGTFDTLLQPGGDVTLAPVYDATTLTLVAQAVPEPGSLLLAACGAGIFLTRRRNDDR